MSNELGSSSQTPTAVRYKTAERAGGGSRDASSGTWASAHIARGDLASTVSKCPHASPPASSEHLGFVVTHLETGTLSRAQNGCWSSLHVCSILAMLMSAACV